MPRPKTTSVELAHLVALRDHHVREAERIENAIAVVREAMRLAAKTHRVVQKVRTRATVKTDRQSRPKDVVRQVFSAAQGKPLTSEQVLNLSGLEHAGIGGRHSARGNATRVVGLVLSWLVKKREIKRTRGGFVAYKLQEAPTVTVNGQ